MVKKRKISTIIITIFTIISLVGTVFIYSINLDELGNPEDEPGLENADLVAITFWTIIVVSFGVVGIHFIALIIVLTNIFCVAFSIRNSMKAPERQIQITNGVLSVMNIILIIMPVIKMILWRFG